MLPLQYNSFRLTPNQPDDHFRKGEAWGGVGGQRDIILTANSPTYNQERIGRIEKVEAKGSRGEKA